MPRRSLLIVAMFVDTFGGGLLVPFLLRSQAQITARDQGWGRRRLSGGVRVLNQLVGN
jgi:hypothetical protein